MAPTPGPNQVLATEEVHLDQHDNSSPGTVKQGNKVEKDIDIFKIEYPPPDIVWKNVILFILLHVGALAGLHAIVTGQVMWQTVLLALVGHLAGGIGITAGVHRLWSHKAYKAKAPLRFVLAVFNTIAFQNSIYEWSRDHRVHHKYSETLADPHNSKRGFFFSHVGWLLCRKHPAVIMKGKQINMADLEADPIVMFQHRHYVPLVALCTFILPSLISWYFWGESGYNSFTTTLFKYIFTLHSTWLVNSAAHYWGDRPYDRSMAPRQNMFVAILALGEGWHNYHHTFPWDYKAAEVGFYKFNPTRVLLDFMAKIGQAYDLKTVPEHIVLKRIARTGDGTHNFNKGTEGHNFIKPGPYAWGDEDIPEADIAITETLYPSKEN